MLQAAALCHRRIHPRRQCFQCMSLHPLLRATGQASFGCIAHKKLQQFAATSCLKPQHHTRWPPTLVSSASRAPCIPARRSASPVFLQVFDFNGTVTATFAGQTHSQTFDSGMIPVPAGLTIGSNSIQFDIDGQHESLSYNAANVITSSRRTLRNARKIATRLTQQHATMPFPHSPTNDARRAKSPATFPSLQME